VNDRQGLTVGDHENYVAMDGKGVKNLKEVVVFKKRRIVQIYDIVEVITGKLAYDCVVCGMCELCVVATSQLQLCVACVPEYHTFAHTHERICTLRVYSTDGASTGPWCSAATLATAIATWHLTSQGSRSTIGPPSAAMRAYCRKVGVREEM
jgi:hypothetical protein